MSTLPHDSQTVSLSVRVYRLLLTGYPAAFRNEYGAHMLQVFQDNCRRTYLQKGAPGMSSLWALTMIDYLKSIIEENLQRGTNMSKTKYIKLSGWALIFAALAIFVGMLANSRPEYNQYNFASLEIDRYANFAAPILLVLGFTLLVAGLFGLLVRYGEGASAFGRVSLWIGIVSGIIATIGLVALFLGLDEPAWIISMVSVSMLFLGLTLFGVDCLRKKSMQRWNLLPIIAGFGFPTLFISIIINNLATGTDLVVSDTVLMLIFFITGISLGTLGYVLQADVPEEFNAAIPAT